MNKISQKWFEFAKKDLKSAEILFKGKEYEVAIYHCHQAIEKSIKAVIVGKKIKLRKTHDLVELIGDAKISLSPNILNFIDDLNPYYNPIRYPDAFMESKISYSRATCKKILATTKEVIKWIKR